MNEQLLLNFIYWLYVEFSTLAFYRRFDFEYADCDYEKYGDKKKKKNASRYKLCLTLMFRRSWI